MSKIAQKLTDLIGNTPLLALNRYSKEAGLPASIVAKLEYFNPLGSVKDRIALALIESSLHAGEPMLGVRPALCLHGGGVEALRDRLPAHRWMPDAVLRGLACWHALRIA